MKTKAVQLIALFLLIAGIAAGAWFGGYKQGHKDASQQEADDGLKLFKVISPDGERKIASSDGFIKIVTAHHVEQLPDEITLQKLFSEWGQTPYGGIGFDPPVYWFLANEDGDFYWVFWDQRDADALMEGKFDKVRVRSIALPHSDSPSVFNVVWGVEPVDFPYIADGGNPFQSATNAEQAGAGQPATRSESKSEGGDKPQPEAEGRSR